MNTRLYVGNLSFHTTEDEIQRAFSEFGEVSEVKLVLDRDTGRSRGFAFVAMATPEAAQKAIENMDGALLDGRALRVNEAEERRERSGGGPGFSRPRNNDRGGGGGGDRGGFRGDRDRRGGDRGGRGRW